VILKTNERNRKPMVCVRDTRMAKDNVEVFAERLSSLSNTQNKLSKGRRDRANKEAMNRIHDGFYDVEKQELRRDDMLLRRNSVAEMTVDGIIWRHAITLIEKHGADALNVAGEYAIAVHETGDEVDEAIWCRIIDALQKLRRVKRHTNESCQ